MVEKLNYCKKECVCGKPLLIQSSFDNGKFVILRCNNSNCLKEYYMESEKAKKCSYKMEPSVL